MCAAHTTSIKSFCTCSCRLTADPAVISRFCHQKWTLLHVTLQWKGCLTFPCFLSFCTISLPFSVHRWLEGLTEGKRKWRKHKCKLRLDQDSISILCLLFHSLILAYYFANCIPHSLSLPSKKKKLWYWYFLSYPYSSAGCYSLHWLYILCCLYW